MTFVIQDKPLRRSLVALHARVGDLLRPSRCSRPLNWGLIACVGANAAFWALLTRLAQ